MYQIQHLRIMNKEKSETISNKITITKQESLPIEGIQYTLG